MRELVKIVRFHEIGGPDVLQIDEFPLPQPGTGEARLRIKAIGLNRAEAMFRSNQYYLTPVLPSKNGYEAAGIVEAVGSGVDAALVGKAVSTVPSFSLANYGVYGEVAIVPASALAAYPERLSFEEGASIWMSYLTAYGALVYHGGVAKGDHVVLTAASSSVGLAAIQVAKAEGGIVIATTRNSAKKAELIAAGADHVIVTDEDNVAESILKITNGAGARIVFDAVAGPGLLDLAKATAPGALILIYGLLSPEPTPFPIYEAWAMAPERRSFKVMGYSMFEITSDPQLLEKASRYIFGRLESGTLKPRIDRTFTLPEIAEAHRYMEEGRQIGKIVVTV